MKIQIFCKRFTATNLFMSLIFMNLVHIKHEWILSDSGVILHTAAAGLWSGTPSLAHAVPSPSCPQQLTQWGRWHR